MNVGVFLPNWIGDAVMATPTLRAIRNHFGRDANLIGIMKPYVAPVFDGSSWFDDRWLYDMSQHQKAMTPRDLIKQMRRNRLDLVLLLTNSFGTAFIAWLGRARKRIGYARDLRSALLTTRLYSPKRNYTLVPFSTLDSYLQLAYAVGCRVEPPQMELYTTLDDELAANEVWGKLGLSEERGVITFNSSGAYGTAKLWPDQYFIELAHRVATEIGSDVLLLCGPNEHDRAATIARSAGHPRVFSLANQKLSIGLSKACVQRSKLLVTTDSGPRHFAAAFGIPLVSLFGPTHIAWSDTHYPLETHLQIPVDCGPCQQPTCLLGHHKCMNLLLVDMVFQAICRKIGEARR
jgi:heptosyltransferase-2